jgi:hypothetical protein
LSLACWRFINIVTALMAKVLLLGNPNQAVGTYLHEHLISHLFRVIADRDTYSLIPYGIRISPRLALLVNGIIFIAWFYFIEFIIYGGF